MASSHSTANLTSAAYGGPTALERGSQALFAVKKTADLLGRAGDLNALFKKPLTGGLAFTLLHTDTAQKALAVTRVVAPGDDARKLARIENGISAVASCGSTVLFVLTSPFTAGVTAGLAVLGGAACAKDVAKLLHREITGGELFRGTEGKAVELAVDTVDFLASLATLGLKTVAGTLLKTAGKAVSKLDRFATGIEGVSLALRGVDVVLESQAGRRTVELAATESNVRRALRDAGIGTCSIYDFHAIRNSLQPYSVMAPPSYPTISAPGP